jgi:hypothetical protein
MLQYFYMYFSYKLGSCSGGSGDGDWSPVIYTAIIVPPLLASCVYNFSPFISKIIEIFLAYDMLNNYSLTYTEYIYIYINIFLNYIQLRKPIAIAI